jgi:hypothetical protein
MNSVGGPAEISDYDWVHAHTPNVLNNRTVNFDKRMLILISRTSSAGASHKHDILCTGEVIALNKPEKVIHYKKNVTS